MGDAFREGQERTVWDVRPLEGPSRGPMPIVPGRAPYANGLPVASVVGAIPLPMPEPPTSKTCSKCSRDLPFDAFNRDPRVRDGLRADCRECQHERARVAYARKTT